MEIIPGWTGSYKLSKGGTEQGIIPLKGMLNALSRRMQAAQKGEILNARALAVVSLVVIVAIVGAVFAALAIMDDPTPQPQQQGKPDAPFAVTLTEKAREGDYRDLRITIRTETDLPSARLVFVPFDGVEVIGSAPAAFTLMAGEEVFYEARVRLAAGGSGAFTAEVIASFANETTLVANDSIRFVNGERASADFKPLSGRVNPISVQEVPVPPANGGAK